MLMCTHFRQMALPLLAAALIGVPAGCSDEPDPAVANPQATAATFIKALRDGDEDTAEDVVLEEEDLAQAVAAATRARLELETAYREVFDGELADDPNLTLLRLARQPELATDADLDLQGDVALLDVGEGRQLRFELEDDAWKLDLAASLGLEGDDAIEQATAANRANADRWSAVARNIREGKYADKDQVVSALMDSAAGNPVANPDAGD